MTFHSRFAMSFVTIIVFLCACRMYQVQCQRTDYGRHLLLAHRNRTGFLQLGTNVSSRFPAAPNTDGITFDIRIGHIYWATFDCGECPGAVYRANTDGSDVTIIIPTEALNNTTAETRIVRIAYDWIGGNIYYTDRGANKIGLCHLSNQLCTGIVQGEDVVSLPLGIALYPKIGKMFWTNTGSDPSSASIYSAAMDGTQQVKVNGTWSGYPAGIAIDFENARLYWADNWLGTVETCTLDGADHYVIANLGNAGPDGIDVIGDYLYWGEIVGNRIWSFTKTFNCHTNGPALLYDEGETIHYLKVYHASKQPLDRENPCVWAGCSHLCALSGEYSTGCLCPEGLQLGSDGKTCE